MDNIVERVKEANPIEDVIEACGLHLRKSGKYFVCQEHDSLRVDPGRQAFWWNSRGDDWSGDTIRFLEKFKGWDFKQAVEWMGQRARISVQWRVEDEIEAKLTRGREDTWGVAQRVFAQWLQDDADALEYARKRGFSDETIRATGIGFSGRRMEAQYRDMRGEFSLYGVEPECPAAVCVLGFRGDVAGWCRAWNIKPEENWLEWKMIPGAMGKMRLVYPHWWVGRVRYFSTRTILSDREFNESGKEIKGKWNPYASLAGPKQPFFNHVYRRDAEVCVIVEGPADAMTLGQWDVAAMALCGLAITDAPWLVKQLEKHKVRYVGLDTDEPGSSHLWKVAEAFGPLTRLVRWPEELGEGASEAPAAIEEITTSDEVNNG